MINLCFGLIVVFGAHHRDRWKACLRCALRTCVQACVLVCSLNRWGAVYALHRRPLLHSLTVVFVLFAGLYHWPFVSH